MKPTKAEVEQWLEEARAIQDPQTPAYLRNIAAKWELALMALLAAWAALEASDKLLAGGNGFMMRAQWCAWSDTVEQVRAALPRAD
jgi:hypothetical protein